MAARPPRVRPRFELVSPIPIGEVLQRVKGALSGDPAVEGLVLADRFELVPHRSTQHFWSPQLTVTLEEDGGQTRLRGRFGPHPHVWTLYVAIHALGALGTVGAAIFGLSQHLVGHPPWALLALPAAPLLAALVWALAFVGQALGNEQMYALRRFLEEALSR